MFRPILRTDVHQFVLLFPLYTPGAIVNESYDILKEELVNEH